MKRDLNKLFFKHIKKYKDKRIIFWGASIFLENFLKEYSLKEYKILGIVDMNKQRWGEKLGNYEIFSPDKIKNLKANCIIISIKNIDKERNKKIVENIKEKYPRIYVPKNVLIKTTNQEKFSKSKFLIKILDTILPKKKNKCVFLSYPDFSDNTKEYYEYLKTRHANEYELVWLYENEMNESYSFIENKFHISSLKGIWHTITAKYLIFTHVNYIIDNLNLNKHTLISLWHGMPLKTLGYVEKMIPDSLQNQYKLLGKYGHFFVSSDLFKLSMQACFMMNYDKVHITGQPRTDCILTNRNKNEIVEFLDSTKYNKIILYTPTYKEAIRNQKRDIDKKFNNIFYFDDYNEHEFYQMLEKQNVLFIIKPHPMDEVFYKKYLEKGNLNHPNIRVLYNEDIINNNFYFYEFFALADLMITDYSSIGIDYLINKKPIIYLTQTEDEYSKNRGFILPDNYQIFMPGEKVNSYKELVRAIEDSLTIDSWKNKRQEALPLLHKYIDNKASERIFDIMKKL